MNTSSRTALGPVPAGAAAQTSIAYLVGRLDRIVRQQLGAVTAQFELTVAQYTALSVLKARSPLSNAQLARRVFITPQAMNELVQALEHKGLVARQADPDHRRVVQMLLTPAGEALVSKCDRVARRLEDRMLRQLAASEREQLRDSLWACISSLERRESLA